MTEQIAARRYAEASAVLHRMADDLEARRRTGGELAERSAGGM